SSADSATAFDISDYLSLPYPTMAAPREQRAHRQMLSPIPRPRNRRENSQVQPIINGAYRLARNALHRVSWSCDCYCLQCSAEKRATQGETTPPSNVLRLSRPCLVLFHSALSLEFLFSWQLGA